MGTATTLVLFAQTGENAGTPMDPVAPWAGQKDLTETKVCCVSYDNDMPVTVPAYEVREVTLPDWLPAAEWCRDPVKWKYLWGAGVDRAWPEAWQRGLAGLAFEEVHAAAALLKTETFRSDFRRSLADQIVAWLETPASERQYRSPLSARQWGCLIRRPWEAKRLSEALYRERGWGGKLVTAEAALAALAQVEAAA